MLYSDIRGTKVSRLGMGNMRLPLINPKDPKSGIDWPEAHKVIDNAYNSGITYFDTAYVYNNGESEKCVGECMKKHPRESFYFATKWYYGANPDYKAVFEEQLARLQTDYIDFYLIHCLMDSNIDDYLNSGGIEFFLEMKKQGKIKHLGFSSHASVETLTRFADHHDWDFAQLQINYYDWNYARTAEEYKVLEDRNIPIVVMEPVRGGRLAKMTEPVEAKLKGVHPEWSIASWALRFVMALPQVKVILSGMSDNIQVDDNIKTFSDPYKFTEEDKNVLFEACHEEKDALTIPCTACCYCTDGCPMEINIPEYLKIYNIYKFNGEWGIAEKLKKVESKGKPMDCINCGACTGHCPQNIETPKYMEELAKLWKD